MVKKWGEISEIWLWSLERENGGRERGYIERLKKIGGKGKGTAVKNLNRCL